MTDPGPGDAKWMREALELAARGRTAPNPRVGAVVVSPAGERLSGGYHHAAGQDHAEVDALKGVDASGATLYVTLEPCNHHGRTPPCTDAVIAAGVRRVVIGSRDPTSHTRGSLEKLRAAGIEVTCGVLEAECDVMVEDFAMLATRGRPLVTLKAAMTLDGRMATRTGDSKWITGEAARADGHRMRSAHDAVMVGVGTILADDARLDVRMVQGPDPVRIVVDSTLRTPKGSAVLSHDAGETWLVHGADASEERRVALGTLGAVLIEAESAGDRLDLSSVLQSLGSRGVMSLMVEGGPTLQGELLAADLVDRCVFYVAPRILGDSAGLGFSSALGVDRMDQAIRLQSVAATAIGDDLRIEGRVARTEGGV